MSIRLRFTLLYTLILALTLTIFGVALYTIQAQDTLNSLKRDLVQGASKLAEASLKRAIPSAFLKTCKLPQPHKGCLRLRSPSTNSPAIRPFKSSLSARSGAFSIRMAT